MLDTAGFFVGQILTAFGPFVPQSFAAPVLRLWRSTPLFDEKMDLLRKLLGVPNEGWKRIAMNVH